MKLLTSTPKMLIHCLLVSIVYDDTLDIKHINVSLTENFLFSGSIQYFLFFLCLLSIWPWCLLVFFKFLLFWVYWDSWLCMFLYFVKYVIEVIISSKMFSLSCLYALFFFKFFFTQSSEDWRISINLLLRLLKLFSAIINLLVRPC